uniref:Uncharacterized protein n=2 Tax=Amphimedon queenslandica TaxID=400682 RepID=A0A1X7UYD8_AMPQE
RMVKSVVRGSRNKVLVDGAVKYCNKLLVTFRCEERRKLLTPTGKYSNKDTSSFAELLMAYMKANKESCGNYKKHVALLKKYIRDTPNVSQKKNFYPSFKLWVADNYGGTVTDESWVSILEEDAATSPSLPATSEWEEASDNYQEFQENDPSYENDYL